MAALPPPRRRGTAQPPTPTAKAALYEVEHTTAADIVHQPSAAALPPKRRGALSRSTSEALSEPEESALLVSSVSIVSTDACSPPASTPTYQPKRRGSKPDTASIPPEGDPASQPSASDADPHSDPHLNPKPYPNPHPNPHPVSDANPHPDPASIGSLPPPRRRGSLPPKTASGKEPDPAPAQTQLQPQPQPQPQPQTQPALAKAQFLPKRRGITRPSTTAPYPSPSESEAPFKEDEDIDPPLHHDSGTSACSQSANPPVGGMDSPPVGVNPPPVGVNSPLNDLSRAIATCPPPKRRGGLKANSTPNADDLTPKANSLTPKADNPDGTEPGSLQVDLEGQEGGQEGEQEGAQEAIGSRPLPEGGYPPLPADGEQAETGVNESGEAAESLQIDTNTIKETKEKIGKKQKKGKKEKKERKEKTEKPEKKEKKEKKEKVARHEPEPKTPASRFGLPNGGKQASIIAGGKLAYRGRLGKVEEIKGDDIAKWREQAKAKAQVSAEAAEEQAKMKEALQTFHIQEIKASPAREKSPLENSSGDESTKSPDEDLSGADAANGSAPPGNSSETPAIRSATPGAASALWDDIDVTGLAWGKYQPKALAPKETSSAEEDVADDPSPRACLLKRPSCLLKSDREKMAAKYMEEFVDTHTEKLLNAKNFDEKMDMLEASKWRRELQKKDEARGASTSKMDQWRQQAQDRSTPLLKKLTVHKQLGDSDKWRQLAMEREANKMKSSGAPSSSDDDDSTSSDDDSESETDDDSSADEADGNAQQTAVDS